MKSFPADLSGSFSPWKASVRRRAGSTRPGPVRTRFGTASAAAPLPRLPKRVWEELLPPGPHDGRFFRLVQETIRDGFDHRTLILADPSGAVRAACPIFLCNQDLLQGASASLRGVFDRVRPALRGILEPRTLMVGSPVGEGVLGARPMDAEWCVRALAAALPALAKRLGAALVVLKEFPAWLRPTLSPLLDRGFARMASMPYVTLEIDFASFEEHMQRSMSRNYRKHLRQEFRKADSGPPITLEVTEDISRQVDELYPLYLQVYERSRLRFERLTPEFLAGLGRELPDQARFFVWRRKGQAVAFSVCRLRGGELWDEYVGMDYAVALDLHLYFLRARDLIDWCCRSGIRRYCGTSLSYDPKRHLRFRLLPMDLYVHHQSPLVNSLLRRGASWLSPAYRDPVLRLFPNANEV